MIDKTVYDEVNFKDSVWALKANFLNQMYSEKKIFVFHCFAKDITKGHIKNVQIFIILTSYSEKWGDTSAHTAMCDTGLMVNNLLQKCSNFSNNK